MITTADRLMCLQIVDAGRRSEIAFCQLIDMERNKQGLDCQRRHPVVAVVRKPAIHDDLDRWTIITGELLSIEVEVDTRQKSRRGDTLHMVAEVVGVAALDIGKNGVFHFCNLLSDARSRASVQSAWAIRHALVERLKRRIGLSDLRFKVAT